MFSGSVDRVTNTLRNPFPSREPFISHKSYSDHHGPCCVLHHQCTHCPVVWFIKSRAKQKSLAKNLSHGEDLTWGIDEKYINLSAVQTRETKRGAENCTENRN